MSEHLQKFPHDEGTRRWVPQGQQMGYAARTRKKTGVEHTKWLETMYRFCKALVSSLWINKCTSKIGKLVLKEKLDE